MNKHRNRILVICGPTATGKTSLGVHLAKKFSAKGGNGEIVSADSRQVYRGMDLATGKDLPRDAKLKIKSEKLKVKVDTNILRPYRFDDIPVFLLDVVYPHEAFSVAEYHKFAHEVIENVWTRGKLPILVGGTGLYIKAIIDGIDTIGVPPNPNLRTAYQNKATEELFDILFHLAPEVANGLNASERKNKVRLIRKIEIAQVGLEKFVERIWLGLDSLIIGLTAPRDILKRRIEERIDSWLESSGAQQEIRQLLASGIKWDAQSMSAIGYRQWRKYFEGGYQLQEVVREWKKDEWRYSKRQLTWFKKDKRIVWFDITKDGWQEDVEEKVRKWYNEDKLKAKS